MSLTLSILIDQKGAEGDVHDLVFLKNQTIWQIEISCKHNHQALKHSRLSQKIDFGKKWFGYPVSKEYFQSIKPIFDRLIQIRDETKKLDKTEQNKWDLFEDKESEVYLPILDAFKNELISLTQKYPDTLLKLIEYLLGLVSHLWK